jgi:histidyl-tRNA synthetase
MHSLQLAHRLRRAGLRVDLYPDFDRYGRQFKYADERKIRYVLLLGPQEIQDQVVAVKDLSSGEQQSLSFDEVAPWLLSNLS